jgi:dTDP-4-amino-4,6-dideoxygalactose transaminase
MEEKTITSMRAMAEKLVLIDGYNKRRREIAQIYTNRFSQVPFIKTPIEKVGHHVYHQYCIQVSCRDLLRDYLTEHQVGTNIFYPKSLANIPFLTPPKELYNACPFTKELTETILALPVWPELTNQEVNYVCDVVESFGVKQTWSKALMGQALKTPNTSSC